MVCDKSFFYEPLGQRGWLGLNVPGIHDFYKKVVVVQN